MATATINRPWASFDTDWVPGDYLAEYYREVEDDERATMRFLVETASRLPRLPCLLEFGCGPTVHHLFPFADVTDEIHVADYLASNLAAVDDWLGQRPHAHDWTPFSRFTASCERRHAAPETAGRALERRVRRLVTTLRRADARVRPSLLDRAGPSTYPLVVCCFCPDSITDDLAQWRRCMVNVASLVEPGGWLVVTALGNAASYRVGARRYPSPMVDHAEMAESFEFNGFAVSETRIVTEGVADDHDHGFGSVVMAAGRRSSRSRTSGPGPA
jgi:hypothetical protein